MYQQTRQSPGEQIWLKPLLKLWASPRLSWNDKWINDGWLKAGDPLTENVDVEYESCDGVRYWHPATAGSYHSRRQHERGASAVLIPCLWQALVPMYVYNLDDVKTHRFQSLDRPSSQTVLEDTSFIFIFCIGGGRTSVIESKYCGDSHRYGEGYVSGAKIVKWFKEGYW